MTAGVPGDAVDPGEGALRSVHPPTVGLIGGVAVLAALAATVGLGLAGWLAGTAYTAANWALLTQARHRSRVPAWGPADTVTSGRAALVGGVTALVAGSYATPPPAPVALLAGLAAVALLLDAADGWVARRTGTASDFGARFDLETDAFLVLVLAVFVAGSLGWWVVAVGAPRYAFVAAGLALPWLRRPPPVRRSGKWIAAAQGVVLVIASAGVVPAPLIATGLALVLALLAWSFGRSAGWLWRSRHGTTAEPAATRRGIVAGRVLSAAACLLVLLALTVPNRLDHLTPVAFLRIPVEGLLAVAALLLLPPRAGRVAAALAGAVIGLSAVLRVVDMGFFSVLARPFDPVLDLPMLGAAVGFLTEQTGRAGAIATVAAAAAAAVAVLALTALSAVRLTRPLVRHRVAAGGVVVALGAAWAGAAALDAQLAPGVPVAAHHQYDRLRQVGASLQDRQAFAAEVADDEFRDTPADQLLTALRGKDVIVAYVESYGRDAVIDPELAAPVGEVLATGQRRMAAAGFASRSAFLTSPTVGGGSWLAHATLRSGVWVDNPQRYHTLLGTDRLTLGDAFQLAGWRTVAVLPGSFEPWPEGTLLGFDRVYTRADLEYRGPRTNWGVVPDQYTLSALHRRELAGADRAPVMAEVALVSSHLPWTPAPPMLEWDRVGDGSAFQPGVAPGGSAEEVLRDRDRARAAYAEAVGYSLRTLTSYVETYGGDDLVLVVLGDHQPPPAITGDGAGADVPVTIITGDPVVLDLVSGWGWDEGLRPGPRAPVWRMDTFRDRFLTAFG